LLRQANARCADRHRADLRIWPARIHHPFINTNRQIADAIAADYRFTE
jgi:hypothetical protein